MEIYFIKKVKELFLESVFGKIYVYIREIPAVKVFFDFDYTSEMWEKSYIKNKTDIVLKWIGERLNIRFPDNEWSGAVWLLAFCPFLGLWNGKIWHIIILTVGLTLCFMRQGKLQYVVFYETVLTVLFAPFIKPDALVYIIYVESAVILFFIVRNLEKKQYEKILMLITRLWVFQCFFGKGGDASVLISFMPYALSVLAVGKLRYYVVGILLLVIGVYALSRGGGVALLCGGIGILVMVLFGEWRMIVPIALVSPWIAGIGLRIIRNGIFSEKIFETGYFFWSRSFKGVALNYEGIDFGYYGIFASLVFSISAFIFFWCVLRMSRQAVLKILKKDGGEKRILRAGLGSIIGFSIYTFLTETGGYPINILVYLLSGAMLRRACIEK